MFFWDMGFFSGMACIGILHSTGIGINGLGSERLPLYMRIVCPAIYLLAVERPCVWCNFGVIGGEMYTWTKWKRERHMHIWDMKT